MKSKLLIENEIDALKALKPKVRQRNTFGDDHHAAIDAQITVLDERLDNDALHDRFEPSGDSDINADEGRADNVLDAAMQAYRWMIEDDNDAPSSEWQTMAV